MSDFKLAAEPSRDLFTTPRNDSFYSRSPYRRLSSQKSEIRLLRVFPEMTYAEHMLSHPGWPRYEIEDECRLMACELLDNVNVAKAAGRYVAISYHAGSPKDTALILVNGIPFNAFANLEFAISAVMSRWEACYPKKELFLWTDQICINQNDVAERSAQVALMPQIYCRALETNVCLATRASQPCLLWVPQVDQDKQKASSVILSGFYRQINELAANKHAKYGCFESLMAFVDRPWWRRAWIYQEFILSPRLYFLCHGSYVSLDDVSCAVDILNCNSKEIFDSMVSKVTQEEEKAKNTYQELAVKREHAVQSYEQKCHQEWEDARQKQETNLKKESKIWDEWEKERANRRMTGYKSKSEFAFQPALMPSIADRTEYLYKYFRQAYSVFHGETDENDILEAGAKEMLDRFRITYPVPSDVSSHKSKLKPPLIPEPKYLSTSKTKQCHISDLQKKINTLNLSAIISMMEAKISYTKHSSLDLKQLLRHSRGCNASDDRDRIYAFLGLASEVYSIKPDYSPGNTALRVLIETAKAIITHDGDLSMLTDVDRGHSKYSLYLPSWVPDWLGREHGTSVAAYISSIIPTTETRAIDASPKKSFHAGFQQRGDSDDVNMKVIGVFVDVLYASDTPFKGSEGLRYLRTQKRARVVASETSQPGDQVWVLYGAKRPVVLRAEGPDKYSYRGEACIHLTDEDTALSMVMFGEMMQLVEEGKATVAEIWLV